MEKKRIFLLFALLIIIIRPSAGQNTETSQDSLSSKKPVFISVLNLRPATLSKKRILISLQAEYPKYYKYFNPNTGNTERVSETTVLNEAYYSGHIVYGVTNRVNLFTILPVTSVHHYSPANTIIRKGIGDIELGGNYSVFDSQNLVNSLTTGLTIGFPTGKYKDVGSNEYPLGLGVFKLKGDITGLHHFNQLDMMYSVYYEYRGENSDGLKVGDEAGAFLTFQKQIFTSYGDFGFEGGGYCRWNFKDKIVSSFETHLDDYTGNLFIGAWYNYLKDFYLRVGVPYTIYQNKSWLTKYEVLIQLDYYFDI